MCAEAVALKLVGFGCGQSVDVAFNVGAAHARYHYVLNVAERYVVAVDVFSERAEQRRHRVGGSDKHRRNNFAFVKSYNLCGASAHVDSYYNSHCMVVFFFVMFM